MDFDCWTGILIKGKPYTIVEKIRYKEKDTDDTWTEYGLTAEGEPKRQWLSISDGGVTCSLSSAANRTTAPQGCRLRDQGEQVVTGVWGDTDASVGDTAKYKQYQSADGTQMFFIAYWEGGSSDASAGRCIAPSDIALDAHAPTTRIRRMKFASRARVLKKALSMCVMFLGIGMFGLFLLDEAPDIGTWHDLRRLVGMPYAMEERISDAPYASKEISVDGAKAYEVQTDAGTAALDLIEGVGGRIMEGHTENALPDRPHVLRTVGEEARITSMSTEVARIACAPRGTDEMPAAEKLKRDYTLARYAEVVRTEDVRGRAVVVRP